MAGNKELLEPNAKRELDRLKLEVANETLGLFPRARKAADRRGLNRPRVRGPNKKSRVRLFLFGAIGRRL